MSVDSRLGTNNQDFLDTAFIHTLSMATGVKVEIDPKIFMAVFNAWQNRNAIEIEYLTPCGKASKRLFEPHVLAYFNEARYIKWDMSEIEFHQWKQLTRPLRLTARSSAQLHPGTSLTTTLSRTSRSGAVPRSPHTWLRRSARKARP